MQDRQDLIRQPWAKRADKIKVKTLLLSKHLFYWVYELAERKMHGFDSVKKHDEQ